MGLHAVCGNIIKSNRNMAIDLKNAAKIVLVLQAPHAPRCQVRSHVGMPPTHAMIHL